MLMRTRLFSAALAIGVFAAIGFAQQPQNQDKGQAPGAEVPQRPFGRGEGRGFQHKGGRQRGFAPRMMQELNLTDEQKQQVRGVLQQGFESTKAQREELRQLGQKRFQGALSADDQARAKLLHEQMRAAMKENRTKIDSILTTEQKAKLQELKTERQARRAEFGKGRRGLRRQPIDPAAQPPKPSQQP